MAGLESGAVDPPVAGTVPLERAHEAPYVAPRGRRIGAALGERSVLGKFVVEPAG